MPLKVHVAIVRKRKLKHPDNDVLLYEINKDKEDALEQEFLPHTKVFRLGVDPDLINKVQDPFFLDRVAQTFKDVSDSIKLYGPWTGAWVGESGGAYNSGGKHVSEALDYIQGFV